MPHSRKTPPYSDTGIELMSQIFEQQLRFAHLASAAAFAGNPFMMRRSSAHTKAKPVPGGSHTAPKAVKRTHSMPV